MTPPRKRSASKSKPVEQVDPLDIPRGEIVRVEPGKSRRNRIALGLTGYGYVPFRWVNEWLRFQAELARESYKPNLFAMEIPYVEQALNVIVAAALLSPEWDYILLMEHDMIMPSGIVDRIANLDPETQKIVGYMYFGKDPNDMRPIPGFINEGGGLDRLTTAQVREMRATPGLYAVQAVGTGATAVHRSVFENWPDKTAWFKPGHTERGFLGHDIRFCMESAAQGYTIWCDSTLEVGHMGSWISNATTYLATAEHEERQLDSKRLPSFTPSAQ